MMRTKVLTLFLYKFTVNADEIGASVEKKCHNFSSTHPFELILVSNIIFDILLSILKQKYPKFVVKKKSSSREIWIAAMFVKTRRIRISLIAVTIAP